MDIEEVKQRLMEIEHLKYDNESAHATEDQLLYDFIEAIKNKKYKNIKEVITIATEISKVQDINFERWYS